MPPFRRSLPIAGVAVLMTAASALAVPPAGAAPRVRPETVETQALLDELLTRSPAARGLVDELDSGEFLVYVRHRFFADASLHGHIGLVRSNQPTRVLIIEIACARPLVDQLVVLGHELQHAVEMSRRGGAMDAPALVAFYARIGEATGRSGNVRRYETRAAQDMSIRIRREVLESTTRTNHDRE